MQNDDETVGRLLTRREALAVLGLSGAALFTPGHGAPRRPRSGFPACVVRPEQTEGPYFVDESLERSDIRSDPGSGVVSPGALLLLTFAVSRVSAHACTPLPGAHVDVWHCDAFGVYSDVEDPNFDTRGKRYLRGYQRTDPQGHARFVTIYPGWYPQRAVHIHFKVRTAPEASAGHTFTSQVYFDERLTDRIHAQPPYTTRHGTRRRNADDGIYRNGGDQLVLDVARAGSRYETVFPIGLQIP